MTFSSRSYLSICILLSILLQNSQADDHDLVEYDFFDEAPLILTASRMSKPLDDSPASVSVINRRMIEASGAREIADLFRLVPGFIVGYYKGNQPAVTYHGLGREFARQTQVLVDGRSVFVPSFGGIPWSSLPLLIEDIERIEIIRGPNAVTYGANAFLATINIITRHSAEDFGIRYSISASDNSNPDIKDAYIRVGQNNGDLDWRLSAGSQNDDGYSSRFDSKSVDRANLRIDYLVHSNQFLTISVGTSNSILGMGKVAPPLSKEYNADLTNSYLNIQWEGIWDNSTSTIRLTHTNQKAADHFITDPFNPIEEGLFLDIPGLTVDIDYDRKSMRTDLEFIQTHNIDTNLRLVYGADLREDRVKSYFLLGDKTYHDVDTARLFTEVEWRIDDNWLLDLGTTLEDSSLTTRESSPRLSIIRKINHDHSLRFVISKAKRNPILWEYEGYTPLPPPLDVLPILIWEGNDQLVAENILSYEIGLHSNFAGIGIVSDIKLFNYEITDHIIEEAGTAYNGEQTRVTGIELSLDYSPTPNLDVNSGFSLLNVDASYKEIADSFPERSAFISVHYRFSKRQEISSSFYYTDTMMWLSSGNQVPAVEKLDLRYAYQLDPASETRIEFIGQNLLGEYNDFRLDNFQDIRYYLRLSGGF